VAYSLVWLLRGRGIEDRRNEGMKEQGNKGIAGLPSSCRGPRKKVFPADEYNSKSSLFIRYLTRPTPTDNVISVN